MTLAVPRAAEPGRGPESIARRNIDSIQWARGIAALGVFLFHLDMSITEKFGSTWWSGWFFGGATGVEFFFILSGFIILHTHLQDIGRPDRFSSFITKRFIRLYPIYWLCVLPLGIALLAGAGANGHRDLTVIQFITDLLLIPREGVRVLQPAWTLQHELVFYIVFSAMIFHARLGLLAFVLWQVACLATLIFDFIPVGYQNMQPLARFLGHENFGFAIGMLIAWIYREYGRGQAMLFRLIGAIGAVGVGVALWLRGVSGVVILPNAAAEALLFFALYAMVMIGLLTVRVAGPSRVGASLGILGSASYVLYLIHEPIISASIKLAQSPILAGRATGLVVGLAILLVGISASIAVHKLIEQPLLALLRNAAFGRRPASGMAAQAS
ncbi:acyltransferase family protein [Methylobacterium sp. M6A4_1b]